MLVTDFTNPIFIILKLFVIVGLGVYLIFAFVIIRQTQIMANTVKLPFEIFIKLLALLHFIFAISILVLSVLYL